MAWSPSDRGLGVTRSNQRRINLRKLARRVQIIVNGLDVPDPFDVRRLCRRVGETRGRPILIAPLALAEAAPCGLWLETTEADYIFFEASTSKMHQDHIILHELGHVLCHQHGGQLDADTLRRLFPALDAQFVRNALGRVRYSSIEEQEAEVFAHLVLNQVWRTLPRDDPAQDVSDSHAREVLRRFASGLDS